MAIRIPTYERHVQLDSGAQTIPRFPSSGEVGKAIGTVGDSMIRVAAHWQAKQDSFDKMQMLQNEAVYRAQITQIIAEEQAKFNPGVDRPGTLHDRIMARIDQANQQFQAQAPASLAKDYQVRGTTVASQSSYSVASHENQLRNTYGKAQLDKISGQLNAQVQANPDSAFSAVNQMKQALNDLGPTSGLTEAQKSQMLDGYMTALGKNAAAGYMKQGRTEDGKAFVDKFVADRNADQVAKVKSSINPMAYDTKLSPEDEAKFQDWKAKYAPNDSGQDYDLRGAYKAGVTPDPNTGHMPDTFKKPNHPTFSDQSQYAKDRPDLAGSWNGETYVPPKIMRPGSPGAPGSPAAPGPQSQDDGKLNQQRIAKIDANPEAKAAIEKAAQATGLDPNQLKVFASIESDGNPKAVTGQHQGLFQLTKAEFGMNNGGKGDILNAEDNAMAAANVLAQKKTQLTQQLGREPTATELYGSHQQGMSGVTAHLQNPDQPAWKSVRQFYGSDDEAKKAISGNVPKDIVNRLYGGDASQISSKEFMAIQGTRVKGGSVDAAITDARMQEPQQPQRTITASADGSVVSDTRPPAYVGGVNVGGQPQDTNAYPGARVAYSPGQTFGRSATANAQPFTAIVSHYTGSDSLPGALSTAKGDPSRGGVPYGYHFLIDKDGTVIQTAPLDARTNHVQGFPVGGRTSRPDISNNNSIGVSFVGTSKPTQAQLDASHSLIAGLQQKYNIPNENVVGHGEIQGGTRDPGEGMDVVSKIRSGAPPPSGLPTQVAQAGGGPIPVAGATPQVAAGTQWDQLGTTLSNTLDGGSMKSAAIAQAMKVSLDGRVKADIASTQLNGKGIMLPKELQDYYHAPTTELSYDLIANKLGTGKAIQWQQDKDFAQKVYNGGAHMEDMPRDVIIERLQGVAPDQNSPYFLDQQKVYNEVLKKAQAIEKERNADPAGYADKDPVVAQALQDARKDPSNQEKTQALITARMNRQQQLGIDPALQTPLSVSEAKVLAQPLLDRARPDRDSAGTEVANNIIKFVGGANAQGVPDLAHRALQTVLRTKNITDQQAAATADALVAAQHPAPAPLVPNQGKPKNYDLSYMAKDGYYIDPSTGFPSQYGGPQGPPDNYADNPDAAGGDFRPGTKFVPASHIEQLRKDPSLADMFDNGGDGQDGYGRGAAKYFLEGGVNAGGTSVFAPTQDSLPSPAPDQPPNPTDPLAAPQPDMLAPDEEQNQPDASDGGQ